MILTYQLGSAAVTVDGILSAVELGDIIDVLSERGQANGQEQAIATAYVDVVPRIMPVERFNFNGKHMDGPTGTPMDGLVPDAVYSSLASASIDGADRQHLEPPNLDDPDALARIAFDAYTSAQPENGFASWDETYTKTGWRAVAAAVNTAAQLQRVGRAVADV